MDTGGAAGGITGGPVERRLFVGVDRGFIFFENSPGAVWRGITSIEESEDDFLLESVYLDGSKIAQRYHAGNYAAQVISFDDPFGFDDFEDQTFGFTYREHYLADGVARYRLHIVHGLSLLKGGKVHSTVNDTLTPPTFAWSMVSVDTVLANQVFGSHLILDSAFVYDWLMRDIENILYGWPNGGARIPTIDEMYEIFSTMNLVIIDHGDGTWSAIGHESQIRMLDPITFEITSPTAVMVGEHEYEIESLIRDELWLGRGDG